MGMHHADHELLEVRIDKNAEGCIYRSDDNEPDAQ